MQIIGNIKVLLFVQVFLILLQPSYAGLLGFGEEEPADTTSIERLNEQALEYLYKEPEKTKGFVNRALALAKKQNDKAGVADAYNTLGLLNDNQGNYEEALHYYLQSLKLFEELDDQEAVGVAYNNLGQFYYSQGNNQLALEYLEKALHLANKTKDELSKGYIYNNLALIYDDQKDFSKALIHYKKAIHVYTELKDSVGTAVSLHNISWLYFGKENYDSALLYAKKALKLDFKNKDIEGIAADFQLQGEIYQQLGDYKKAILNYHRGLEEARKVNVAPIESEIYRSLAESYYSNKEFDKAIFFLENYSATNDSIFNQNNFNHIATIQAKYDAKLQEKEISLLQSQKKLNSLSLSFRQTFTYLLIGSGGILLVLLVLLFLQNRENNRTNKVLNAQIAEINKNNATLTQYNRELKESRNKLKEFNETKDKFFSIISHDLKSPLNSLTGLLQLLTLQSDSLTQEELMHLAKSLGHSIDNLSDLLDNLLQWSMSQMGRIEREPRRVNLKQLVQENLDLLKLNAEAKKIKLKSAVGSDVTVYADVNMVSFIVRNLLTNAIKFTSPGGSIVVSGEVKGADAYFIVQDDGVGISAENLNKLFKIGQNFTTQGTSKEKGTGLGLVLCKEFVEKNNGQITVESVPKKGTTFTITLPAYLDEAVFS